MSLCVYENVRGGYKMADKLTMGLKGAVRGCKCGSAYQESQGERKEREKKELTFR